MGVCKVSIRYECKHRRYLGRRRSCPHGHGTEDDKQHLWAELDLIPSALESFLYSIGGVWDAVDL